MRHRFPIPIVDPMRQRCPFQIVEIMRQVFPAGSLSQLTIFVALVAIFSGCETKTQPGIVVGSSMAPSFLGEHFQVTCSACQSQLKFDPTPSISEQTLVCSNCGYDAIERQAAEMQPANLVRIEPNTHKIERWDAIAFRIAKSNTAGIKRVVGLPSESLTIRGGNLFVDGTLLRKPFAVQKKMRILVNDSRFVDNSRWSSIVHDSGWDIDSAEIGFRPRREQQTMDWIVFHPQRCYSHSPDDNLNPPIEDNYGYNQTLGRDLNPMDELFVEMDLALAPSAIIGLQFVHRSRQYSLQIDLADQVATIAGFDGDEPVQVSLADSNSMTQEMTLEMSTIDRNMIIVLNGTTILDRPMTRSTGQIAPFPIKFGAASDTVVIRQVRIWRDVYYLPSTGIPDEDQTLQASRSGYLLLGDNSPISIDSRHWESPAIEPGNVLGRVFRSKTNDF